jgi:hypothetical protein
MKSLHAQFPGGFHQEGCAHTALHDQIFLPKTAGGALKGTPELLALLANRTTTLCGDSVQEQLYDGLQCALGEMGGGVRELPTEYLSNFDYARRTYSSSYKPSSEMLVRIRAFEIQGFSLRIRLIRHYKIKFPGLPYTPGLRKGTTDAPLFLLEEAMRESDVVLLQMCGHWNREKPYFLSAYWAVLLTSAARHPSTRMIVTGCMPQHFHTADPSLAPYIGDYQTRGHPGESAAGSPRFVPGMQLCASGSAELQLWQDRLAKEAAMDHKVPFLDLYSLFRARGDLHPRGGDAASVDCAHYCYTSNAFSPILHILHSALICQPSCFG